MEISEEKKVTRSYVQHQSREKTSARPPKRTTEVKDIKFDDDIERIVSKYQNKAPGESIQYTAQVTTTVKVEE